MRNPVGYFALTALLASACAAPTETDSVGSHAQALAIAAARGASSSAMASSRFGRPMAPRSIHPAFPPRGLDARPVKVMVEVDGDPITLVQARAPERKLTRDERAQLRAALRARQAPVQQNAEALGANVVRSFQNAYNGFAVSIPKTELARLRQLPGVVGVHPVRVMRPSLTKAVPFVAAPKAWSGPESAHGEGIKVAVIDTGIDYTHANFGGPGTVAAYQAAHANETQPADATLFGPNAPRVKGGIDLVGDAYNEDLNLDAPGTSVPMPDSNPLDCNGHGSHTAGIVGGSGVTADGQTYTGPYNSKTLSSAFRIGPGVAPHVDLYAVRLFGCEGSVSTDIVVDAIEWAVDNDMDVINMSLGSPFGGADDAGAVAASNAVKAGVVVATSAGNQGHNPYMAGTPSTGDGVLSVAAMDGTVPTYPGATLTLGESTIQVENSNGGAFADGAVWPVVLLGTPENVSLGCDATDYARSDVPGALVVTLRGTCPRVDRATLGQQAGAAAVAMINTSPGYPPFEGAIPGVTIPFFGALPEDAAALAAAASASADNAEVDNVGYRTPVDFTSSGPRFGDSAMKPNVITPGLSVVSTSVGTGTEGIAESGTSMAAPLVAGLAALTRQAHCDWTASEIAAAISNTADPSLVVGYSTRLAGVGVPQADKSVKTTALATVGGVPGVSFGFLELGADVSRRQDIVVRNRDRTAMTFDVFTDLVQGVPHTISVPTRLRVPGRGSAELPVSLGVSLGAATDPLTFTDLAGVIRLTPSNSRTNRGVELRVPYYGVVRPEARLAAQFDGPGAGSTGTVTLTNPGSAIPGTADFYAWGIAGAEDPIGCNDVRAVGVQSFADGDDRDLVFAINGWRRCSNSAVNEYDIIVTNGSGDQYGVIGADSGLIQTGEPNGELATFVLNLATGDAILMPASAPTDSNMVYLLALGSQLGVISDQPRFTYFIQTSNGAEGPPDPPSEAATFNAFASALIGQGEFVSVAPSGTASVSIDVDPAEWAVTPPKGLMIVFAQNAARPEQAALFPMAEVMR
jgi:subtilisin family serine protease